MKVLKESLDELKEKGDDSIPGTLAFKLYDTYGLSVDIVEDVAKEEGLKIDITGYERAMSLQRSKSQESWKGSGEEEIPEAYRKLTSEGLTIRFLGYETLSSSSKVMARKARLASPPLAIGISSYPEPVNAESTLFRETLPFCEGW